MIGGPWYKTSICKKLHGKVLYQEIIKCIMLNTMLHHVGMLWIIETHEQLQYDTEKHN